MLFTAIVPFALIATTSAGVLRRNDQATNDVNGALQVLDRINAGMSKLGQDVKLWNGDRPAGEVILEDGRQIISDLGVGAKYIEHASSIRTFESMQLVAPLGTLNSLTDVFSTELIRKKDMIDKLELAPQTLTLLEHARHGALDLSREVALKLPATTSWAASPLTNNIVGKLDKAITTFGAGKEGQLGPAPNDPQQPSIPNPYQSQPLPWAEQGQSLPQPQNQPWPSQPQTQPWPSQPQSQPQSQPWPSQPQSQPQYQPQYQPQSQPQYQPQSQPQPQPWQSQPEPQPDYPQQQDQPQPDYAQQQGQDQGDSSFLPGQDEDERAAKAKAS
ncbi:hypothetical protein FKW77_004817 [Venturia effusa]|uniref:Uncharacterized protein n=1 Tax=Venturia effusa TaxID=50376 RepID=A0A517LC97_9PEZI|nr:hypothetical protein FKW77_004817 [Venturia effusa]